MVGKFLGRPIMFDITIEAMNKSVFMRMQRWAFEITLIESIETILDGYCCFITPINSTPIQFAEEDSSFIKCTLSLLVHDNIQLLVITLDSTTTTFIIDHTLISRIVKPTEDTPYLFFEFGNVTLCFSASSSSTIQVLEDVLNKIMKSLEPCADINVIIRKYYSTTSTTIAMDSVTQYLNEKYTKWITFLNQLNSTCSKLFMSNDDDESIELNTICNTYLDSIVNYTNVHDMYRNTDPTISVQNFSHWIDKVEKQLELEIEKDIAKIFSFSNNRSAPSTEALKQLEQRIQQVSELSQQSLLLSSLSQKHFHS
jgi:hypothetical protein